MKRFIYLYLILIVFLGLIAFKTYQIMIVDGEKYKEYAISQSGILVSADKGRGNIYDRNLLKFTSGGVKKTAVVVKTDKADDDFTVCCILDKENPYELYNELYEKEIVYCDVAWDFNKNLVSKYKNVYIFEDTLRYSKDGIASAVIGYTSDGKGVSGIEYTADRYLKNSDNSYFYILKDAYGRLLPGISFDITRNNEGLLLKTTLDKKYSEICQKALEGKKGAVVILEIPSFNLISMVSSPTFDSNKIEKYLNSENTPLLNRATSMYDMGSIFKIIVASAALENNSIKNDEKFHCNGIKNVEGVNFLCQNHEHKPYMTLNDAFIHSCNSVFIDIGQKTRYNNIIAMAYSFGIGDKLIYPVSFPQNGGILPDANNYYLADEANLSIGQGKLLGTAVHGAYFSAIIANNGVKKKINILDKLLDKKGDPVVDLKEYGEKRVVSEKTAQIISKMMLNTVEGGTGTAAYSEFAEIAGKTGSAQTGMQIENEPLVHAWFTGFFPAENPKYAMCVFIENGKSGGAEAAPVFKEICEKIVIQEGW